MHIHMYVYVHVFSFAFGQMGLEKKLIYSRWKSKPEIGGVEGSGQLVETHPWNVVHQLGQCVHLLDLFLARSCSRSENIWRASKQMADHSAHSRIINSRESKTLPILINFNRQRINGKIVDFKFQYLIIFLNFSHLEDYFSYPWRPDFLVSFYCPSTHVN